jgi:hypothetical protein
MAPDESASQDGLARGHHHLLRAPDVGDHGAGGGARADGGEDLRDAVDRRSQDREGRPADRGPEGVASLGHRSPHLRGRGDLGVRVVASDHKTGGRAAQREPQRAADEPRPDHRDGTLYV